MHIHWTKHCSLLKRISFLILELLTWHLANPTKTDRDLRVICNRSIGTIIPGIEIEFFNVEFFFSFSSPRLHLKPLLFHAVGETQPRRKSSPELLMHSNYTYIRTYIAEFIYPRIFYVLWTSQWIFDTGVEELPNEPQFSVHTFGPHPLNSPFFLSGTRSLPFRWYRSKYWIDQQYSQIE